SVLDDGTAAPDTGVPECERPRVDGQPRGIGSDPPVAAHAVIHRRSQLVRSTSGHRVDGSADEVAFTDVVRRDAHLQLLGRLERDRGDEGSTASLPLAKAERAVEVRTVNGHVVYAAILARE